MQAMFHIYAAVSYICIGDAESSAKVLYFLPRSEFVFVDGTVRSFYLD